MTFLEKISFLKESLKLNDRQFAKRYKINFALFKKWKTGAIKPQVADINLLCKEFKLDPIDFLSDSSTLGNPGPNEHSCNMVQEEDRNNVIYEDFSREDNSRYEEKD